MRPRRSIPLLARFCRDERGAEVSELAVVLALIVASAVAAIMLIGPKVVQYYSTLNNGLP